MSKTFVIGSYEMNMKHESCPFESRALKRKLMQIYILTPNSINHCVPVLKWQYTNTKMMVYDFTK